MIKKKKKKHQNGYFTLKANTLHGDLHTQYNTTPHRSITYIYPPQRE